MKAKRAEKSFLIGVIGLFLFLTIFPYVSHAAIPQKINYQGYLTNAAGVPVNGTVQMHFSIYNVLSGGSVLWTETQNVTVTNGVYSVSLGDVIPITLPFDVQYYLGVAVGADPEMTPRKVLTSVGYAFRALTVESIGSHIHSGADITSGMVSEPRIDPLIARDSEVSSSISSHAANASAHHTRYTDAEAVAAIKAADGHNSGLDADLLDGQHASAFVSSGQVHTKAEVDSLISGLQSRIAALEAKLSGLTRSGNDFVITNANLYIQSGSGTTDGTVNGKGNLIIGYNELRGSGDDRTGSHNLIVGKYNNYSRYGGIVVGYWNTISGNFSSVSGGIVNTASNWFSSVSGGTTNTASGYYSSANGGYGNSASGDYSSVSGGWNNTASGDASSVNGGRNNTASGNYSSVAGGGSENPIYGNKAFGHYAAILGGDVNIAGDPALTDHTIGMYSTVCGGGGNIASGNESSVNGGLNNTASGHRSSVSGGGNNIASDLASSVSGGINNTASGVYCSVSGGYNNTAANEYSSVSGGRNNIANSLYSSVGGGYNNTANGYNSSVGGGRNNIAHDEYSSVSGGRNNIASGFYSSVSGGYYNTAYGMHSSVSGGAHNTANHDFSSISGGADNNAAAPYSSVSGGNNNTAGGEYSSVSGGSQRTASGSADWVAGFLWQDF